MKILSEKKVYKNNHKKLAKRMENGEIYSLKTVFIVQAFRFVSFFRFCFANAH